MTALYIEGHALWPPGGADAGRPKPALPDANTLRRAPDSVLVALHVAQAAVAMAGADAATLASVFTSAHGDLPIVDAMCKTLASDPLLLSPTRFHHAVHNAASGYWAMASGSHAPSTALSAFTHSFAAGWLEAAGQCQADQRPVLLVGYDTAACGALASVNRSVGLLGVALVLSPQRSAHSRWAAQWSLCAGAAVPMPLHDWALQALAGNAMADALPLFEALAADRDDAVHLPLGAAQHLRITLQHLVHDGASTPTA